MFRGHCMTKIKYFRCAFIVRGRGQEKIDELLPEWARIVSDHSSKSEKSFNAGVDAELISLAGGIDRKTAANYRTENLGKILGLYYTTPSGKAFISKRAERLLKTSDQMQFFKDLVCKMQVPSGISKKAPYFIRHKIVFMPASYILEALKAAEKSGMKNLSKQEINYFILSNLPVLQGKVKPSIIVKKIKKHRNKWKFKTFYSGSKETQHSNEVLNLLKYANVVKIEGKSGNVSINRSEIHDIERIIEYARSGLSFQAYSYQLDSPGDFKKFEQDWEKHFSMPCFSDEQAFATDYEKSFGKVKIEPIGEEDLEKNTDISTKEIGDTGERFVFDCERKKVFRMMRSEYRRVHLLSNIKGIGFDVQSVRVDAGPKNDDYIYIEVKTTPRATKPQNLCHLANLTENEFKAARQHGDHYFIYKVYLTPAKKYIYKLQNPFKARSKRGGIVKDGDIFRVNSSPDHWVEEKNEAI